MKVSDIAATILLAASLSASAAVINHTDAFATSIGDTAGTEAAHFLSYTDTDPTPAASPSEIRTQDGPFNNGGTLFLAALENEAQSAPYLASKPALGRMWGMASGILRPHSHSRPILPITGALPSADSCSKAQPTA